MAPAAILALLLGVEGLKFQDSGPESGAALGQASGEMAATEEAGWPGLFGSPRRTRRQADASEGLVKRAAPEQAGRIAVLVSGSMKSLLLTPLLANVVRANAMKGIEVDLYFGLKEALPGTTKREEISDPKIASLLSTVLGYSFNKVMESICHLARSQLAAGCHWDLQSDDGVSLPKDAAHQDIMRQASPLNTTEGKAAVARWRSLSRLWNISRTNEAEDEYSAVVVARDDIYWLAPRLLDVDDFELDSLKVSAVPCLDATGVNDKAVVMGRDAADVMLSTYEAWRAGDPALNGTRSAEEVWFRRATEAGVEFKPEPMYAAMATYTQTGLPCFQEQTFKTQQGIEQYANCFGESFEKGTPVSSLFQTFSCDTMNPVFYDLLWPQQVRRLHQVVSTLADKEERSPVIVTVIDADEIDAALLMLSSLQVAGEEASSLVIGTSTGICKAMAEGFGAAGNKCIVLQPAQDVQSRIFKHAILTTVALAGLSDRLVYASPRMEFKKPLTSQLAVPSKRIHFASSASGQARDTGAACREESGSLDQIDSAVMYLSDAPEASDMLLRAWARMEEDNVSQQEAIIGALESHGSSDFGLLSCGLHSIQAKRIAGESNRMLSAEQPPGAIEKEMRKVPDTAWIDRLRDQESKQRVAQKAEAGDAQKRADWQKKNADWKEVWAQRIHDLEVENNYNETEVKELRRKQRVERRANNRKTHHTKRVRYLPPEEAAKVKAKDEAWEAQQEKQRKDDEKNAESRREDFRRQVEKAQAVIESRKAAAQTENELEAEMIAG
jgi:hypothetical protein